ncbi:MAG TPA: hypothetical protein VK053_19835 [Jiangellaceae bacterium]|nr:hypothetical protein [Jiangellaceae bacterium]
MVDEVVLRQHIMARLAEVTQANGGFVSRQEISSFTIEPGITRRLVDTSKGIWNPRDLTATLSVVSSPDGPYADEEVEDGLFHYDYRSGSHEGDNRRSFRYTSSVMTPRRASSCWPWTRVCGS